MKTKEIFKLLEEKNKITPKRRIRCNCGRCVSVDNIIFIHPIDMNYFNWWSYQLLDNYKFKLRPNKWYGYIGYIPILHQIVYFLYEKFHKKDYFLMIECKYCENTDDSSELK